MSAAAFNADVGRRHRRHEPEESSLFDPVNVNDVPVHADATDTETAAANRIAEVAGKLRAQVLQWIIEAGAEGMTGKEAGSLYALSLGRDANDGSARYSVMPRCELRQIGLIRDSGRRRDGSSVWVTVTAESSGD